MSKINRIQLFIKSLLFETHINFFHHNKMKFPVLIISFCLFSLTLCYDTTVLASCPSATLNCSIPACSLCSNQTCLRCTDPYSVFNSSSSTCVPSCNLTNCAKCKAGSTFCTQCKAGFTLYSLTNQCVSTVISNCLVMHDFRSQEFQCTLCAAGYKPSLDQSQCIVNGCSTLRDCQSCKDAAFCDKCRVGYQFNPVKVQCQPSACSISNCLYCNTSNTCLRCNSNYTLNGNQCNPSACTLSNCQTCKPGSIFCDNCQSGYSSNLWTKVCQGSSSNLKYLWLLWLLLIPVIIAIVVCILKKRPQKAEKPYLPNDSSELKPSDNKIGSRIDLQVSYENVNNYSSGTIPIVQTISSPTKVDLQAKN